MHEKTIHETEHAQNVACEERGQTMAEYGVVLTVITLAIVTAFAVFGTGIERSILRAVALIPK
jgi:Flp pilus assembly pilin Flp